MSEKIFNEERALSACEVQIMKVIWDAGEDIPLLELIDKINAKYGKDYKRTTVTTFLLRLSDKGYAKSYRKGKASYVHAVKEEEEYRQKLLKDAKDTWFGGKASNIIAALCSSDGISKEDAERIREILDGLDN